MNSHEKILYCMKLAWWKVWSSSDYVLELREGELYKHYKSAFYLWDSSQEDGLFQENQLA